MDYQYYTAEDFIKDEYFQQWVYSPEEETDHFWEDLLKKNPHQRAAIDEARQFLQLMNFKHESDDSRMSRLRSRVYQGIDQPGSLMKKIQPVKDKRSEYRNLPARVAASIVVLLSAFALCYYMFNVIGIPDSASAFEEVEVTPKGKRSLISLRDGTKVWLNADSRLKYSDFTGHPAREVFLEGEAFFDVAENKERPFIVNTSDIAIKVLGTSFNVKSYPDEQKIETTLVEGKVSIESKDDQPKQVSLLPNQKAVFEKESGKIILENEVDVEPYTSWKNGALSFDDQPFSEIVFELERWYNVTIHIEDKSSLACRFSAKINNKTLKEVMELFKSSDGIQYRIDGDEVFITGKLCD
jgi:transmembrane sensor